MVGIFSVEDKIRELFLPKELLCTEALTTVHDIYKSLDAFEYRHREDAKEKLRHLVKSGRGLIKIHLTADINYDKEILRFAHSLKGRAQYIIDIKGWTPQDCYRNIGLLIGHPIVANPMDTVTKETAQVCKRLRQNGTLSYITVHTAEQLQQFKEAVDGFILPEPYSALRNI
jgi:hypothetical protein